MHTCLDNVTVPHSFDVGSLAITFFDKILDRNKKNGSANEHSYYYRKLSDHFWTPPCDLEHPLMILDTPL